MTMEGTQSGTKAKEPEIQEFAKRDLLCLGDYVFPNVHGLAMALATLANDLFLG